MNKYIYEVLATYYKEISSGMKTNVNFAYKKISDLYNGGKITMAEKESLFDDVTKTLDTALKIISDCPYIKICINNDSKIDPNNYFLN